MRHVRAQQRRSGRDHRQRREADLLAGGRGEQDSARALRQPDYQASLRSHIAVRSNLFVAERFVSRIREVVGDYLRERPAAGAARVKSR